MTATPRATPVRDTLEPCPIWYFSVTASRTGTPRTCSPAGTTSISPSTARTEAREAGRLLAAESGLDLRILHTSVLTRAIRDGRTRPREAAGRTWLPVRRHWRLNERHYGALQGKNKKETTAEHGTTRSSAWRRSYATPPPPGRRRERAPPGRRSPLPGRPDRALPTTDAWPMSWPGSSPTGRTPIVPDLLAEGPRGGAVLVVAHGNSLRALRKHSTASPTTRSSSLEIPTGIPFVYELDDDLSVASKRLPG